jgi:flagellar export protein FliJ
MRPFRFSLQSIRVLREQRERDAQQRFGRTMRICEDAACQLQQASEELAAGWDNLCRELSAGVAAMKLLKIRGWCNVLEHRQKQRRTALLNAQRDMDDAWRDVMLATRDREAMDRYHDKRRRAYDREAGREEQKMLDELGVRRAVTPGALRGGRPRGEINEL